jgi:hypothetical protein
VSSCHLAGGHTGEKISALYKQNLILTKNVKFIVNYSAEKDINNYLNSVWKFSYLKHGRENIQDKLLNSLPEKFREDILSTKDEKEAKKLISIFLDNLPQSYKNTTPLIVLGLEKLLNNHKKEIIKSLESAYSKPFPFETITVYLTTLSIQPYSYEDLWFMAYRNNSIEKYLNVAKHELNHFMFYYNFLDKLSKAGLVKEKFEKLKEAFAILTNPEGNDKPDVKELEQFILSQKRKPVEEIINLCIESGWV